MSTVSIAGGLATLPFGRLVDRVDRTRLLAGAIATWAVAMILVGASTSFTMLVLTRVGLGVVVAAAGPSIASLVGDLFPGRERARVFGMILVGEYVGAGFGLLVAGELAALSWRLSFWVFVVPALILARLLWRFPEPTRGEQEVLLPGAQDPREAQAGFEPSPEAQRQRREMEQEQANEARPAQEDVKEVALAEGIDPREELVLRGCEPQEMTLWQAIRYVLRIPTNVLLVVASSVGYLFFTAVQTFGVIYAERHWGISQAQASPLLLLVGVGAVFGLVAGGSVADRLFGRGRINARVLVLAVCYVAAACIVLPGIVSSTLLLGVGLLVVGSFVLAAANAPLDAARLDVMHHRLWGRAEGVRFVFRTIAGAIAPPIFGLLADHLAGGGEQGMTWAFVVFLVPLAANGLILVPVLRTYPRDVATAGLSERQTGEAVGPSRSAADGPA